MNVALRILRNAGLAAVTVTCVGACGGMSGLGAASSYRCQAPDGVRCESLSGVYANAVAGTLPSQRPRSSGPAGPDSASEIPKAETPRATLAPLSVAVPIHPIRTEPKVLRGWIAPYEDADGDFLDQQFVYMPVHAGKWAVEHARRKAKDSVMPAQPVQAAASATAPISAARAPVGSAHPAPPASPADAASVAAALRKARSAVDEASPSTPGATE